MKKPLLLLILSLVVLGGCKKDQTVVYDVEIIADLSGPARVHLDNFGGVGRMDVTKSPFKTSFSSHKDQSVHVAASYGNSVFGRAISLTVSSKGKVLQSKTGTGSVDVQFVP